MSSRGINPTLYDPRIGGTNKLNFEKVAKLQESLSKINSSVGFAHVIPSLDDLKFTNTKLGPQAVGSPPAYHLAPTPFNFEIKVGLLGMESICPVTEKDFVNVPLSLVNSHGIDIDKVYSDLSEGQKQLLSSLEVSLDEVNNVERMTVNQRSCKEWFQYREKRLTASNIHRIFIRKRQFDNLVKQPAETSSKKLSDMARRKLKHGVQYKGTAREKYHDILKYKFQRHVKVKESGFVINPSLFWLGASPDGFVVDGIPTDLKMGLIEIKCPETKKNCTPTEAMQDSGFYFELVDGKPKLEKHHSSGYYSQVQLQLGLTQLPYCDFVVYTFKGIIISRIAFNREYFSQLVTSASEFYFKWYLPCLLQNKDKCNEPEAS